MILSAAGLLENISPAIMIIVYCFLGLSVGAFVAYLTYYLLMKRKNKIKEDYPIEKANEFKVVVEKNTAPCEFKNEEGIPYDDILEEEGDRSVTYYVNKTTTILPRCFLSKLKLSDEKVKKTYSTIKNELMSFDGVNSEYYIGCEVFVRNGVCARIKLKNNIVYLYLNTRISHLVASRYNCRKVADDLGLLDTDIEMAIINKRMIRYAKVLIYDMFATADVYKYRGFKSVDYCSKFVKTTNTIMAENNIKILEENNG